MNPKNLSIRVDAKVADALKNIVMYSNFQYKSMSQSSLIYTFIRLFLDFAEGVDWKDEEQVFQFWEGCRSLKFSTDIEKPVDSRPIYHSSRTCNDEIHEAFAKVLHCVNSHPCRDNDEDIDAEHLIYEAAFLFLDNKEVFTEWVLSNTLSLRLICVPDSVQTLRYENDGLQKENEKLRQEVAMLEELNDRAIGRKVKAEDTSTNIWAELSELTA